MQSPFSSPFYLAEMAGVIAGNHHSLNIRVGCIQFIIAIILRNMGQIFQTHPIFVTRCDGYTHQFVIRQTQTIIFSGMSVIAGKDRHLNRSNHKNASFVSV